MSHQSRDLNSVLAAVLLILPGIARAHEGPIPEPMSVQAIVPGGAVDTAGLRVGDHLIELDSRKIATMGDLEQVIGQHEPGDRVPMTVLREGELVELKLTFGKREEGGAALGVSFAIMGAPSGGEAPWVSGGIAGEECVAWVDGVYQLEYMSRGLELDLSSEFESLRACMAKDLVRMPARMPYGWCDNVFKVHCDGLSLLTELGVALTDWCEKRLGESLELDLSQDEAWTNCAADTVFERYSLNGQASDEGACHAAYQECSVPR